MSRKTIKYTNTQSESFICQNCGQIVYLTGAGSSWRNHCPHCLHSVHLDDVPGDRAAHCGALMEPIGIWVRQDGEWALIHRCRSCGKLSSNRIAADDDLLALLAIALKPLSQLPVPLEYLSALSTK